MSIIAEVLAKSLLGGLAIGAGYVIWKMAADAGRRKGNE